MDTKDMPNPSIEPAGDSRPIKCEALLEHEIELIRRVNGLLRGMHRDARQYQGRSSLRDPWAVVDHNRRYRTLMISGPRGSGKTSVMLTYRQRYAQSTGRDPFRCPHCGGEMAVWRIWHPKYGVIYDEGEVIKRGTYTASASRAGP